ncbi:uncharacterized protein LOC107458382 [Arachis duranensis]|uniref:Uncharacterized protein LOC107458382 n=1 Tax=Arachis duranensis TaxID=130453 RepID=A0A6P4B4L1_ARADU|nr:uncharacterized protein LOC107458382 [Arachis duranensis]
MVTNSVYIVVCVYPNCCMRNGDNGVIFECENLILLRTQHVNSLSKLKSLILSNADGTETREVGRVGHRVLASLGNGVFRFQLFRLLGDKHVQLMFDIHGRIMAEQVMKFSADVGDIGGGGSIHSTYVQDDRPLAPPPIHVAIPVADMELDEEDSDEEYIAESGDSDSSEAGDDKEFVLETPAKAAVRYVLSPPHLIPALSDVPSHYHTLDLDAMHERILFSNMGEEDYNLDGVIEFRVGHKFKCRDAVMQGVKNYSIFQSAKYWVIKSDRLKYNVQCRQAANGCPWNLRIALRQNLGYW